MMSPLRLTKKSGISAEILTSKSFEQRAGKAGWSDCEAHARASLVLVSYCSLKIIVRCSPSFLVLLQ